MNVELVVAVDLVEAIVERLLGALDLGAQLVDAPEHHDLVRGVLCRDLLPGARLFLADGRPADA